MASSLRLTIEGGKFCDTYGRHVLLRGINVGGDAKLPSQPDVPSHIVDDFFDGDNVKFHSRPFRKEDAHIHFSRLKRYGYNTIRYIFTWEAIEAAGPGRYDEEWIQHTIEVLRTAKEYGFYIFMDPHQDVWSRYCGGSGAPMWTVYACGLNPQSFAATEAAIVHNTYPEPEKFPKMIWSTNYYRLAAATIFTFFFAGRDFAPKCIINGMNIQDYLQGHFMRACAHLAQRIHEAGDIEDDIVFGWESLNEPHRGMIGHVNLSVIPKEQQLKKGTCPTLWQAILTGSGRACEVDSWDMGGLGPYKIGRTLIDPHGEMAWLPTDYDDSRYGWKRDPGWKMGECIWAQHGVWDPSQDVLLKKDYFEKHPKTGKTLDYPAFTNTYFMDFYRYYRDTIRAIHKDAIMLCQPPVLEIPPSIKGTKDDDPNMVYAPHYYDGITLMTKKWNRTWNVDVFGVLRGKYLHPAFAIKIGETAIRNSFKEQLAAMRKEGQDYMGNHPCVLTEFGIPYDMDDKHAYKTGDYSSQSAAMDANHFAVEGALMEGYTLWLYSAGNDHQRGDQWNGEDLSIFSADDQTLPVSALPQDSSQPSSTLLRANTSASRVEVGGEASVTPSNLKRTMTNPSISSAPPSPNPELTNAPGYRAAEAYVRPAPIGINGSLVDYRFDLKTCEFTLDIIGRKAADEDQITTIFLPDYHFPKEQCTISVTSGKWEISTDDDERAWVQKLRWWHGEGKQSLKVTGLVRPHNALSGTAEEAGYLEQCQASYGVNLKDCIVM
ncbi:glycoside hydrolase family 5 protein [Xylariaceae sp. FL0016]|nr:glycoside hydrolase family 5 protein [Xylariaceae sp. FL0016]